MALISERRQRNRNNSTHWPGISKSVAMRIAYDWFFDTRIDSSGPTISNSIGWRFLCGQCQASPYIPSMPASITYWRDRLKLKLILMARLSRVAISFRAGPRIWACAWPPTEKAPLELVLYCWHCRGSHVHDILENLQPEKKRTWSSLVMAPATAELYTI